MPVVEPAQRESTLPVSARRQLSARENLVLLVRAARPRQWVKNFIAYAPLIFACKAGDPALVLTATLSVLAFCLVSGAVYILNDFVDREADRKHPSKCLRPLASGLLDAKLALSFGALLGVSGLILSFTINPSFLFIAGGYLALSVLYCFFLKHCVILDVFAISAGFVLRAVGGAVAISVPSSGWFLACTTLGSLFLALEKRRQELSIMGEGSTEHRKSLAGYSLPLIDRMESIVVPSLLTSYAFYSFMSFHGKWMMLTVPFVLYGIMRYHFLSTNSTATAQPEDVFWSDRPIQAAIAGWLVASALVVYFLPS